MVAVIKKDSFKLGIIVGLCAPLLGVCFFYFLKFFPTFSFAEYFKAVLQNKPILTAVSSISLLVNVAVFTFYINRRLDKTAKGIFLLTVIYILSVLLYKLL